MMADVILWILYGLLWVAISLLVFAGVRFGWSSALKYHVFLVVFFILAILELKTILYFFEK